MTTGHGPQNGQNDRQAHDEPAIAQPNLNSTFAKTYLDKAGAPEYLDAINPDTLASLEEVKGKLEPLTRHLTSPRDIVSVGVGAGEETQAAAELFLAMGATVYGLDVSPTAVARARERMARYGLPAEIVEGSATDLPFETESVGAFILSSIMHEIYSYVPDGKAAWTRAIEEVALKSTLGGKLLLRDFAAPSQQGMVTLTFLTEMAADFYAYFAAFFRTFPDDPESAQIKHRRRFGDTDFPLPQSGAWSVQLEYDRAAEVLLHFKNYSSDIDRGLTWLGNPGWKELNESYLPPHPSSADVTTMDQDEYIQVVIEVANRVLHQRGYTYVCVESETSARPLVNEHLADHFALELTQSSASSLELIAACTTKMELVFSKERYQGGKNTVV